jgi:predicted transcriptional regulator of viral defense system
MDMGVGNTVRVIAEKNDGIVTTKSVVEAGFSESSLRQYRRRHPEELEKIGSGVYLYLDLDEETKIRFDNPTARVALGLAGPDAYLTGSSVLDFYNLANANPKHLTLKTTRRFRREFPKWMQVSYTTKRERVDEVNGIRLQNLAAAFQEAKDTRLDYRLQGLNDAEARNLIGGDDADEVRAKLEGLMGR